MSRTEEAYDFQRPTPPGVGRFFTLRPHGSRACFVFAACLVSFQASAQPTTSQAGSPQPREFQPGVSINWTTRAVYADGQVVLREGPVEYLACFRGKEHESVVSFDCSAEHLYMALGLIGLTSGSPPRWDQESEQFRPATGDLVDVRVEWESSDRRYSVDGFDWLSEIEYSRPPIARPWVYSGSRRLADGTLAADRSGDGIAVVDKPDALLSLSRGHVSRNAELWAVANTPGIPPLKMRVRIVFHAARARERRLRVDRLGDLYVDGHFATYPDGADLIKLSRRLAPEYVQRIELDGALAADRTRLRRTFIQAGVRSDWYDASQANDSEIGVGPPKLPPG